GRGAAAAADRARGAASGLGLLGVLPPLARAALALPHPFTPHDGAARLTVLVAQARRAERRPTAAARDLPAVVGPSGVGRGVLVGALPLPLVGALMLPAAVGAQPLACAGPRGHGAAPLAGDRAPTNPGRDLFRRGALPSQVPCPPPGSLTSAPRLIPQCPAALSCLGAQPVTE